MVYQNATAEPRDELTDVIMEGLTLKSQFVGLKVLPPLPTTLQTFHVPKIKISTGNLMRATTKARKPGSDFDRWQSEIDDFTATTLQIAEEVSLPDELTLTYEEYFAFESFFATEAANRLLRSHELDVEAAIFNTTTFSNEANGSVAYSAANIATITPVLDIITAIRTVKGLGEVPNTILIPGIIYDRIRQSANMLSFIAGSIHPGALVTPETIQSAFESMGIKQVLIPDSYVNQSQSGTTNSINPTWPVTYIFVGNCTEGQLQTGGVGRTFYWEKEGPLLNIQSYRDEPKKSNIIRALKNTTSQITNGRAGTLIGTQVTS
jgi:hypothetical protein